jgi:hypothetical protein
MLPEMNDVSNKFVRIYGIASKKVEKLLRDNLKRWPSSAHSCTLFVDYSDFDIPMGTNFTFFSEDEQGNKSHRVNGKLIQITQSWLKPFDQIPSGHKTICEIELDEASLTLLQSKLPTVDSWSKVEKRFLLGG